MKVPPQKRPFLAVGFVVSIFLSTLKTKYEKRRETCRVLFCLNTQEFQIKNKVLLLFTHNYVNNVLEYISITQNLLFGKIINIRTPTKFNIKLSQK